MVPTKTRTSAEEQLKSWEAFYYTNFGIDHDFSMLTIPKKRPGFDRLIVVPEGMTEKLVYRFLESKFNCDIYSKIRMDFREETIQSERSPTTAYAIWVRKDPETDEHLLNLSAGNLAEKKILGVTLLEHLLHTAKYYDETGEHLDRKNITLCSASHTVDPETGEKRYVLTVYWMEYQVGESGLHYERMLCIDCKPVWAKLETLGAREVIVL